MFQNGDLVKIRRWQNNHAVFPSVYIGRIGRIYRVDNRMIAPRYEVLFMGNNPPRDDMYFYEDEMEPYQPE